MKEIVRKCATCHEEAYLRGYEFHVPRGIKWDCETWVRRYKWWCKAHYIENMFGLYPYRCTSKSCRKDRERRTGCPMVRDRGFVWLSIEALMDRDRRVKPKCPWCGRAMRSPKPKPSEVKP